MRPTGSISSTPSGCAPCSIRPRRDRAEDVFSGCSRPSNVARLSDSALERRFLALVKQAGLTLPQTRVCVNGFRVDFFWPDLGLVVEVDGLRYHRTASAQTRDRARDQAHTAAGLTQLRFTHAQARYQPHQVKATLSATARRRGSRAAGGRLGSLEQHQRSTA